VTRYLKFAGKFTRDERAASMYEYALLLILIFLVCLSTMSLFGSKVNSFFSAFASTI
jgi:Flp pilus assembly pilin Flp